MILITLILYNFIYYLYVVCIVTFKSIKIIILKELDSIIFAT